MKVYCKGCGAYKVAKNPRTAPTCCEGFTMLNFADYMAFKRAAAEVLAARWELNKSKKTNEKF